MIWNNIEFDIVKEVIVDCTYGIKAISGNNYMYMVVIDNQMITIKRNSLDNRLYIVKAQSYNHLIKYLKSCNKFNCVIIHNHRDENISSNEDIIMQYILPGLLSRDTYGRVQLCKDVVAALDITMFKDYTI